MSDPRYQPLPENTDPTLQFDGPLRAKVVFRTDPLQIGRIKVEIPGVHKPDEDTDVLPWVRPSCTAWEGGGDFVVPPIGAWVTVTCEGGDHAYPVYAGGWWVDKDLIGELNNDSRWRFTLFGGAKWEGEILKLEAKADPKLAPNNFARSSPLGKRLELDDRKNQQKITLSDQLSNGLFINTERGSLALESWNGILNNSTCLNGLLLTPMGGRGGGFQLYNDRGWRISVQAEPEAQVMELASPSGAIIRIDDLEQLFEMWTPLGNRIAASDKLSRVEMRTPANRGVILDDSAQVACLMGSSTGMYVLLDEGNSRVDVRSTGDLRLTADGNILLSAAGSVIWDGAAGCFQQSGLADVIPTLSGELATSMFDYREALPFFTRPYEEAEITGGD